MKRGINGFQPERLQQVLSARRLSQIQLATMVGMAPSTVSKWKAGTQAPDAAALERLAFVVNVAPEWFTRPISAEITPPLYRSNASAHAAARAMLAARTEWAQDVALALEEFMDFPAVNIPARGFLSSDDISQQDIEAAAQECRDAWGLGSGPIPDVSLALENAGVILVREETGTVKIEGLSTWAHPLNRPIVLLVADKGNAFRGRFDAAHELGHLMLHKSIPATGAAAGHAEMEQQAHAFAGAFLLPAETFAAEVRLPVTLDSLLLLKQRWGASVGAMIMRLRALDIINDFGKTALFKQRSARWGAKSEPGDSSRQPETPRMLRRAVELVLDAGIMTIDGVARHFGLSERDVESLTGLPALFLDGKGDVVELPKLKDASNRVPAPRDEGTEGKGQVLPFSPVRRPLRSA